VLPTFCPICGVNEVIPLSKTATVTVQLADSEGTRAEEAMPVEITSQLSGYICENHHLFFCCTKQVADALADTAPSKPTVGKVVPFRRKGGLG
jgi:hypothetical protein